MMKNMLFIYAIHLFEQLLFLMPNRKTLSISHILMLVEKLIH